MSNNTTEEKLSQNIETTAVQADEESKQGDNVDQTNATSTTDAVDTTTETPQSVNNESQGQQTAKKSKYLKRPFQYCKNYDDINQIVKAFPALNSLLVPLELEKIPEALCYVIRSNNDDDVHKAIKYGIWTSVPGNNVKLNAAWEKAEQLGVDVYLFFSVVKSGQFNAVARLKSSFQEETFSYWWQPHKFKGHFKIEWVFVKDVKQKQFEGLKNSQGDDISRSKDCTELSYETTGKKMLQIFQEVSSKNSIFKFFEFFDRNEKEIRRPYTHPNRMHGQGGNPQLANAFPNPTAFFYPQGQIPQGFPMFPMYQKKMFPPQFIQQMGYIPQQYTPEALAQLQNACETHIYPPNTNFQQLPQQQLPQQQMQQQQYHHHQHPNAKNFNHNNHSGNQYHGQRRNNNNNNQHGNGGRKQNYNKNDRHQQNQQQQQNQQFPPQEDLPQLESLKQQVDGNQTQ